MSTSRIRTRLARLEEKNSLRRAYLLIIITLMIIISLFIFGIPLMVKVATLLGELKSSEEPIKKTDNISPQIPLLEPYSPFTNSKTIDLNGKTEAGVVIVARVNDYPLEQSVSDDEGKFLLTIPLTEGPNNISILAKDTAGNESETKEITITFDDIPPDLEITNPPSPNSTTEESRLNLVGRTEPTAQIYLNQRRIIVDRDGNFESTYFLQEGDNSLILLAKDAAGNETTVEVKIRYERF